MKLIEYMPTFLQEVQEFKEIFNSEDIEIEDIKERISELLDEVVVQTAKSYGLDRYEKIYGITNITTDIERRRFNILSKINNRIPYTLNWLKNKLNNLVGKDNYEIILDHNNYKITVNVAALFNDIAIVLNKDLREQLPANLLITVNLFQTEQCETYYGGIVHIGDNLEIRQVM